MCVPLLLILGVVLVAGSLAQPDRAKSDVGSDLESAPPVPRSEATTTNTG